MSVLVQIDNNERTRIGGISQADEDVTIKQCRGRVINDAGQTGKEEQMYNSFYSVNNWYVLLAIPRRVNAEQRA